MVEFAIVLPLLLMVLFAIVQLGITYRHYEAVTDAARVGARKAAVSRTAADPAAAAENAARGSAGDLDQTKLEVTVTPAPWAAGSDVKVEVSYPYSIDIFGIPVKTGFLTSSTTERVE
jgi:Flp pilus assembly protein TadG